MFHDIEFDLRLVKWENCNGVFGEGKSSTAGQRICAKFSAEEVTVENCLLKDVYRACLNKK